MRFQFQLGWSGLKVRFSASDRQRKHPKQALVDEVTKAAPLPIRYRGFVAGVRFYDGRLLVHRMRRGMVLGMVRDRHNPHDANAIQLMIGSTMLGFVPKGPNEVLARRLDRAEPLVCRIERISRQSKPWKQIEICIESLSIAKPWWTETELDEQDDSLIHFSSDHAMGSRNVRLPREDRRMGVADFE